MNTDASPAPVRAVIADDERLMREQLRARLAEVWPDLQIAAEAKNGLEAVELVEQHRPDLVFLDIRMPGLTGVDAARQIAQMEIGEDESLPEIVFITAYDQYAVEAFEQGVADYVLKPAERERLQLTVQRIKARLARRGTPEADSAPPVQQLLHRLAAQLNPNAAPRYLEWIQATVGQEIRMIPVADILFFISDETDVRVVCLVMLAAAVLRSYLLAVRGLFLGLERFGADAAIVVGDRLLLLAAGAAALAWGGGLYGLAGAFIAARLVTLVLATRR